MTRSKILGLALGASLLLGYEPIAEATPMAAPPTSSKHLPSQEM